ncbi:hypothetical protein GGTG_12127 [Gaeumannomyces tritici R3-111a-1]|uniref:Uncharacterized protein n=1 Tax=Gaeumannomyces tritici (strain R3-111a-1) TaxID=644352 RepID=J3PF48_GAET3|nr:hypothetical protein GGTG_12127 [Gaeumannomyces tritici R3-111a-1]EJT71106.1 hypothetical protein GGTG_12127 [Gaeumannomyces tritici R3-111a-1]
MVGLAGLAFRLKLPPPKKNVKKPVNGHARKICKKNRLNAVSKGTKTSGNHVLFAGATIVAAKIVGAESGTSRRQYGRRTLTGNRAAVLGHFLKLFKKFNANLIANHVFAINIFKKPRTIIETYRYTGVNGIILICLTIKITAIKYQRLNTNYLRLQSLKLLEWLLNAQKGKKRPVSLSVAGHWGDLAGYRKLPAIYGVVRAA